MNTSEIKNTEQKRPKKKPEVGEFNRALGSGLQFVPENRLVRPR